MPEKKNGLSVERADKRFTVQPSAFYDRYRQVTDIGSSLNEPRLNRYDA
ncbi:MAG TPA: hypothetical protein VFP43_18210 [Mesorhizobium sp.]|nr:hypothetical protein [Mesorhizobium sp.]